MHGNLLCSPELFWLVQRDFAKKKVAHELHRPWNFMESVGLKKTGDISQCHHWFPDEIGSLRNDDHDGNENGKKAIGLDKQNNNFARASRFFVHFSAVVAGLQRETA